MSDLFNSTAVTEGTPLAGAGSEAALVPGGTPGQMQGQAPATSGPNAAGQDAIAIVQQQYPQYAWLLYTPLADTILQLAANGTTPNDPNFDAALQANQWWSQFSTQIQSTLMQMAQNPGEFVTSLQKQEQAVQAQLTQLGVTPDQNQINALAFQSLFNGWSDQELANHINQTIQVNPDGSFSMAVYHIDPATGKAIDTFSGREAYYGPQNQPGTPDLATAQKAWGSNYAEYTMSDGTKVYYNPSAATNGTTTPLGPSALSGYVQTLQALASNDMVTIPQNQISTWATQIASGATTIEDVQAAIKNLAMSKWGNNPDLLAALQRGDTTRNYFGPYVNEWANMLGVSPDSIDLNQQKWSSLLTSTDPTTGQVSSNPIWQTAQTIRSNPIYGWQNTPDARSAAYGLANTIGQTFGILPAGGATVGAPNTPGAMTSMGGS